MTIDELKTLRARTGLSQEAFAHQLGIPLGTYEKIEGGAVAITRMQALAARALSQELALAQWTSAGEEDGDRLEPADPHRQAIGEFLLEITRLQGRLLSAMKDGARASGLEGASDGMILDAIVTAGAPPTAPRIARSLGYSRQAIHRVLENLEKLGLITTRDNPGHKTARLLVATPAGRAMIRENRKANQVWVGRVAYSLSAGDITQAVEVLRRFRRALEKHHEE